MSRPYGVALLIAGVDENGPCVYQTDPSGTMIEYKAKGIGAAEEGIQSILNEKYNEVHICFKLENGIGRCKEAGFERFEGDNGRKDQQKQRLNDGDFKRYKEGGEDIRRRDQSFARLMMNDEMYLGCKFKWSMS